jgi:hypothetical protein
MNVQRVCDGLEVAALLQGRQGGGPLWCLGDDAHIDTDIDGDTARVRAMFRCG